MGAARTGCLAALAGVLVAGAGTALLGWTLKLALEARLAAERPLPAGDEVALDATVPARRLAQVALAFRLEVPAEVARRAGNAHAVPYEVPIAYRVEDASGTVIAREELTAQPGRGTRVVTGDAVARDGGTLQVEHGLAKFAPPADGRLRVVARLGTAAGEVALSEPRLRVYGDVSAHKRTVLAGLGLLGAGLLAAVIGAAVWLGARRSTAS